jgi:hypothetical protein
MRRLILFLAIILLPVWCWAEDNVLIKTIVIDNTGGNTLVTYVNTTVAPNNIVPGIDKIVDVNVIQNTGSSNGVWVSAWDDSSATFTNSSSIQDNFAEAEAINNTVADRFFMYPKKISKQLMIIQSAFSTVHVSYTR